MSCRMIIRMPSEEERVILPGRSVLVKGDIITDSPLPDDALFCCMLMDNEGNVIRQTRTCRKDDRRVVRYRNDLTGYPENVDPGREEYAATGFVEMLCEDLDAPEMTIRKASIKAFYNDEMFRTVLYCATDVEHGLVLDDTVNWLDDEGKQYTAWGEGRYIVEVTLSNREGQVLAKDSTFFEVGSHKKTMICRFNPKEHKYNMFEWARSNGFSMEADDLPGYLMPYHHGEWLYHMGLLGFYRSNDVAFYQKGKVHMFIYEIAEDSTSYSTELGFLMSRGDVADPERFEAFCYDCGEAVVGEGTAAKRIGQIVSFGDTYMHIYRMDVVTDAARENLYDLNGGELIESQYESFTVRMGDRIAITGATRPYQLLSDEVVLNTDNTYEYRNYIKNVKYTFIREDREFTEVRELNMDRIKDRPLEKSVYEFYNIFRIDERFTVGKWNVSVMALDAKGKTTPCRADFTLEIQ